MIFSFIVFLFMVFEQLAGLFESGGYGNSFFRAVLKQGIGYFYCLLPYLGGLVFIRWGIVPVVPGYD